MEISINNNYLELPRFSKFGFVKTEKWCNEMWSSQIFDKSNLIEKDPKKEISGYVLGTDQWL